MPIYSRDILESDPSTSLDELTKELSKSLHKVATNAFPYTMGNAPKLGRFIHNSWHVEECHVEEVWDLSIPL